MAILLFFLVLLISGCLESPEDRLQRQLEQKLYQKLDDTLTYYQEFQQVINEYNFECIDRVAIQNCLKSNPNATQESCKWKAEMENSPPNKFWLNYPQCKKGAESQECEPVHQCKNQINDGGIVKCDPKELEDWERRCGFRK